MFFESIDYNQDFSTILNKMEIKKICLKRGLFDKFWLKLRFFENID